MVGFDTDSDMIMISESDFLILTELVAVEWDTANQNSLFVFCYYAVVVVIHSFSEAVGWATERASVL